VRTFLPRHVSSLIPDNANSLRPSEEFVQSLNSFESVGFPVQRERGVDKKLDGRCLECERWRRSAVIP
jgi:hypothetical protein